MLDALIIGSGYLGSAIKAQFSNVKSSSLEEDGDFYFSLENSSLDNLPAAKLLIISCTIENLGPKAQVLAEYAKNNYEKTILISSASLYEVNTPNEVINEDSKLKPTHPRTICESYFENFASILHCGLLWDDNLRQPHKWLARIKNGLKHVNLCKIDLVAQVCFQISLMNPAPNGHYLCSDGQALRWNDIAERNGRTLDCHKVGIESKILGPQKLRKVLKSKIDWNTFVYCDKKEPL